MPTNFGAPPRRVVPPDRAAKLLKKMSRPMDFRVFTTGEVALLCAVSPRTAGQWVDSGKLRGYRIPGSNDRRVPAKNLAEFMRAHGMDVPPEVGGGERVACHVPGRPHTDLFDLATAAARGDIAAVLFGPAAPLPDVLHAAAGVRRVSPLTRIAVLLSDDRSPADVPTGAADAVFTGLVEAAAWLEAVA